MTLAELKTSHPELYAQVVKDAQDAERDRINAWMVYADIDLEGVKKGIEEGKPLSAAAMADYNRKAVAAASLTKLETESAADVTTAAEKITKTGEAEKADVSAFKSALNAHIKKPVTA
jgi:hypothetical protein